MSNKNLEQELKCYITLTAFDQAMEEMVKQ